MPIRPRQRRADLEQLSMLRADIGPVDRPAVGHDAMTDPIRNADACIERDEHEQDRMTAAGE